MTMRQKILEALAQRFPKADIVVTDDSEAHRGHAGYRDGGETHFTVRLRAHQLAGMTRIARHRSVHDALSAEILDRIHALSLDLAAPDEGR